MEFHKFKQRLDYAKEYRKKQDVTWYVAQTFIDSNTYWSVDVNNQRLVKKNPTWIQRKVNLSRPLLRNVINNITRNNPRWHPEKSRLKNWKSNREEKRVANVLLNTIWNEENCKLKLKDIIRDTAIKWIWFWEIAYDPEKKDICVQYIDSFDIYIDPSAKMNWWWIDSRYIIKAVSQPLENIINTSAYNSNKNLLKVDNKIAESEKKEKIIQTNKWWTPQDAELWDVILYEYFYKENWTVYKQTFCQDYELTKPENLKISEYPIVPYQMERMQGRIYPTSWTDPVVEMNKSVNRIVSSLETYVHTIAKGRYLKRRSERISTVSDQHWQFINYDNVAPTPMNIPNIGSTPFEMMNNFERWVGDSWGSYSLSAGRAQAAKTRSGTWVAQMQQQELESVAEPLDNLQTFLQNVWEVILEIASQRYTSIRKLYWEDNEVQVVWEKAQDKIKKYENTTKVRPFKWITVDIIPWSAFSDMQQREDLITLKQAWVNIPDKYIIQTFQMWNTDDIIQDIEAERLKNEKPDLKIAEWENQKMLQKQQVNADIQEDHRIHKALHSKFLESVEEDSEITQLVIAHIKQHEMIEQWWNPNNPELEAQPPKQNREQNRQNNM